MLEIPKQEQSQKQLVKKKNKEMLLEMLLEFVRPGSLIIVTKLKLKAFQKFSVHVVIDYHCTCNIYVTVV